MCIGNLKPSLEYDKMEAIVEYNYVAREPDELTLKKGDIITEIKVMFGGWWEGTLRDKRGMFPDNFVKVIENASTASTTGSTGSEGSEVTASAKSEEVTLRNGASGRRWCKVLFSYEPCNEDELTLLPQETIEFLGEVEEGWYRGRLKGQVGVFPSNFVSPPVHEKQDKQKERDKKELCRVLFPYEAANEDELTLSGGDIIAVLSKDAPDKGWWIGELNGQVGFFPDNFVETIDGKSDHQEPWHEMSLKSTSKHSHQVKKSEKAHVRKSLDVRNVHGESTKKIISSPSSTSSTSPGVGGNSGERKSIGVHSTISNLKRLVGDMGTNNGNGNTNVALGEELDGVERGEGAPLSHLTASRAKAPRRRPPSSRLLRRHNTGPASTVTPTTTLQDDSLANGNADSSLEYLREEFEELTVKTRRITPSAFKMNQLERRKIASIDRVDKLLEAKKERNFSRVSTPMNVTEPTPKPDGESEESKQKDKGQKPDTSPHLEQPSTVTSGSPAYVPYSLYCQLLDRVAALEEKQASLQQTVELLREQLPHLANTTSNFH